MTAPNIVLFLFDDLCFEQIQRMPQVQKLALTGVNFMRAYTETALCQPARMTLLTGQYSHNHGLVDNSATGYPIDHTTMLAARLQAAGYQTCHVGKYLNSWAISNPIPPSWNEWHHLNPEQYFGYSADDNGVTTTPPDYNTTAVKNRAVTYAAAATQPFFMQVAFKCPHPDVPSTDQLNATPDVGYAGVTRASTTFPRNPNFNVQMGTPPQYMAHTPMDSSKIAEVDAFWRGQTEMLYSGDQAVAAIIAALTAAGKMSNTIIIITADHGYFHGEGRDPASKVAPYLPSVHIPLIISGPSNLVAQNKICDQIVSHTDVTATIFALSGAVPTRSLDGVSLTSLLLNPQGAAVRKYLLLEFIGVGTAVSGWQTNVPICRSVITKTAFYTSINTFEEELYDILNDPWQLVNQANNPAYADIKADLISKLNILKNCVGPSCVI